MLGRSEQVLVKATWGWAGGGVAPGAPATWLWVPWVLPTCPGFLSAPTQWSTACLGANEELDAK